MFHLYLGKISRGFKWLAVAAMAVTAFSCSSSRTAESPWTGSEGKTGKVLTAEQQRLYNALYTASVNERLAERLDAAYVLLEQAVAVNPNSPEALYDLGMLLHHNGYGEGGMSVARGDSLIRRATELAPENVGYLRSLAMNLAETEDFEGAMAVYEKAIALEENVDMLAELYGVYRMAGQNDKALEALDRFAQLNGVDERICLERYRIFIEKKDTAQAYSAIDAIIADNPGDPYYRVVKANLYHEQGYNQEAMAIFNAVLEEDPKFDYARVSLLSFYKTLSEDSLYQQLFHEMVEDPDLDFEVRCNIMRQFYADALEHKKNAAEVLPLARKVLDLPQENRQLAELTLAYMAGADLKRSDMVWVHQRLLEIEPDFNASRLEVMFDLAEKNDAASLHLLCADGRKYDAKQIAYYLYDAMALNELERMDEAIEVLEAGDVAIDSTTDDKFRSQMSAFLGDMYHEKGEMKKAYAAYEKAVAFDEDNLPCLNNYAYYLSTENIQLEKAEAMSKRTVEAEPENPTFLDTYAWILYQQERYTQARIYIEETLKFIDDHEDNSSLYDHAGDIYFRCGEVELAVAYWKKALKVTEKEEQRKSLRKKIKYRKI